MLLFIIIININRQFLFIVEPLPTHEPSFSPTLLPTDAPSFSPTPLPTLEPSYTPTIEPSYFPSLYPTLAPTISPTLDSSGVRLNVQYSLASDGSTVATILRSYKHKNAITTTVLKSYAIPALIDPSSCDMYSTKGNNWKRCVFKASSTGSVSASTCSSYIGDTNVEVRIGGIVVASNNDYCGLGSNVTFNVIAGDVVSLYQGCNLDNLCSGQFDLTYRVPISYNYSCSAYSATNTYSASINYTTCSYTLTSANSATVTGIHFYLLLFFILLINIYPLLPSI